MTNKEKGMRADRTGSNPSDIRQRNRALVLKLIALRQHVSRVELARMIGLTKTTLGNIVAELVENGLVNELNAKNSNGNTNLGRRPIELRISDKSPCICGILIRRDQCTGIVADLTGQILFRISSVIPTSVSSDSLITLILDLITDLQRCCNRKLIAIGVASMGPVDVTAQKIVNPPNFYGIQDVSISAIIKNKTGLPSYLIHDADAGALAEYLYGHSSDIRNFIYLHIRNGIGAGYILQGQLYRGDLGQCGEIGHTSINYSGPLCECGNNGCLELYANVTKMNQKIKHLKGILNQSPANEVLNGDFTWEEIVRASANDDFLAVSALDEFCTYLAYALANTINLLDVNHILIGYDSTVTSTKIEKMLEDKLNTRVLVAKNRKVIVKRSVFGGDAPLIGSVAQITDLIFQGKILI
ncbi:MAG: ROK family transcriptional regulator [Fibrobacter sp.]|nr:ROK family transcriptional regulator [Fibrobacter sp.]